MYPHFKYTAQYLNEAYSADLIVSFYDEKGDEEEILSSEYDGNPWDANVIGYICPECGEPIYYNDWEGEPETENWTVCPVCEFKPYI